MKHIYHKAKDRRCYNGANCSDLQKEIDSIIALEKEVNKIGGHCTFFPMESKYSVGVNNKRVTKDHDKKGDALIEFLNAYKK